MLGWCSCWERNTIIYYYEYNRKNGISCKIQHIIWVNIYTKIECGHFAYIPQVSVAGDHDTSRTARLMWILWIGLDPGCVTHVRLATCWLDQQSGCVRAMEPGAALIPSVKWNVSIKTKRRWPNIKTTSAQCLTDFRRQNLTSIDVRFWRLKSVLAL